MLLCARAEWAALWQRATLWLVGAQVIVMLLSIIPVERALKARFGAQGRARGKGGSSS